MDLKSRRAFKFESLEDRVCLSVSAHSITAVSAVHGRTHPTRLTGTLRIANPSSDANNNSIQGTGSVPPTRYRQLLRDGHSVAVRRDRER